MAAALRLLPRRQTAAPATLALLQPLVPASTALFSKPPYPLHAVGAGGLQDLRRAQFCSSPVPSLLRLYSSKGFAAPELQQPIEHQATCRLKKLPSPLQASATTAAILPGSRRMQLLLLSVPSLMIRHLSSTGKQHIQPCNNMMWFLDRVEKDVKKHTRLMNEAFETCEKACRLLEGLDDQAFAMFDQGMEDYLKAVAVIEKVVDDFVEVTGSCNELPLDTREKNRLFQKEVVDSIKTCRQNMKELAGNFETLKKRTKGGWQVPMGPRGIEEV